MSKLTATIELHDGSLISLDNQIPQTKKAARKFVNKLLKRGFWYSESTHRLFSPERFILAKNIKYIEITYYPIVIPRRPNRPRPEKERPCEHQKEN